MSRDPANARYARVVVLRRDPLGHPEPISWPLVQAGRCSLWAPIPVGEDEDGNQVTVTLPERNLLAGGEPGAGKSNVGQVLIAAAALDPPVVLTLLTPSWLSWRCGRAAPTGSSAPMSRRPSTSSSSSSRSWMTAT